MSKNKPFGQYELQSYGHYLNLKKSLQYKRMEGSILIINANDTGKDISSFVNKSQLPPPSDAYKLFIKAEALRMASLHKESISKYLASIMLERDNAESYYGLGLCYKKTEKIEKAIDAFEKAKKYGCDKAKIHYELGLCYLLIGEVCQAMQNLVESIKLNPDNLNAQIQLAIAHEMAEEEEISLMIYQKIIETKPHFLKAYDNKSSLLMNLERFQEASAVLNKLLKINPDYYRAYLGIGICFDKLGKNADASRYYKKFLDYKPHSQHSDFVKTRLKEIQESKPLTDNSILRLVK